MDDNVNFFLTQAMDSLAANGGSVHADTCVSDVYCDEGLNGEIIFDTVTVTLCKWTFKASLSHCVNEPLRVIHTMVQL